MNEVGGQNMKSAPEETEPSIKRMLVEARDEIFHSDAQKSNVSSSPYYPPIDPSQPSTSNLPIPQLLQLSNQFQYDRSQNESLLTNTRRFRPPPLNSSVIDEAARKNGMQTIDRSGSRFVVPISMQAHPTPITDRILDEKDDILKQDESYPYCCLCHCIIKTWRGFEYHVLKAHIKYRAYRCFHCQKESFYTEEEGRFHLSVHHPDDELILLKEHDVSKENAARNAFKHLFLMCRDGPEVTAERIEAWELDAAQQVMKFLHLRFKRPVVVVKKTPSFAKEVQTDVSQVPIVVQPIIGNAGRLYHNIPLEYHHLQPNCEFDERVRPPLRSTATLHDEDPRDREKRVAALMHAVHTSSQK